MISKIPHIQHVESENFFLMAGPCVVESRELCEEVASFMKDLTTKLEIPYIFKASYRKANRSKLDSFMGIGDKEAMEILAHIREKYELPVVTDIHTAEEAAIAAEYADVLQIPAFLCRQTDLLVAAGKTGKHISIKKGQFLSGESMQFAVDKIASTGNDNVMLTERGNTFGYTDLVVDYRNLTAMKATGKPVIMDITHSLQQPNQTSGVTGGKPELIATIAKAAVAVGADGLFIETHPRPGEALSDGANMLMMDKMEELLTSLIKIRKAVI